MKHFRCKCTIQIKCTYLLSYLHTECGVIKTVSIYSIVAKVNELLALPDSTVFQELILNGQLKVEFKEEH